MSSLYSKKEISKEKIQKIQRDIIENKYVNTETWELLDILTDKRKSTYLKKRYIKFDIINKYIMNLYKDLWATNYGHLLMLIQTMWSDNCIYYEKLGLSVQWLKNIKRKFKQLNIIKRGKLEKKSKYYLNPDISTYWDKYDERLKELFNNKII